MRRSRRRTDGGAAAVEFALVLPVVLLLVFGVVQYGYHYWALSTAAATAREAARQLVVGTDVGCTVAEARAKLDAPHLGTDAELSVVPTYGTPPWTSSRPVRGQLVTVTVELRSLDLGFIPVPDGGRITERATNRVENVPVDALDC